MPKGWQANWIALNAAFRIFMAGFDASSSAMRLCTVATRFVRIRLRIAVV
jgi:hypothetical protein